MQNSVRKAIQSPSKKKKTSAVVLPGAPVPPRRHTTSESICLFPLVAQRRKESRLNYKKKKLIQEDHRLRCARWVVLSFRQTNQTCSSDWRNLGIALHFSKAPSKRAAVLNVCSSNLNVVVLFTPSWEKFQQFHMRKLDNRFLGFDVKTRLNNSQSNLFF